MTKLLIADRDQNERSGITWLVNSYSIPFEKIVVSGSYTNVSQLIESELPDVLCVELDMIPEEYWLKFAKLIGRYGMRVIAMTAEATYERAFQAIQLHAIDLWVKPHSPDNIKRVLSKCCKSIRYNRAIELTASEGHQVSYDSLFLNRANTIGKYQLMLLQLDNKDKQNKLLSFISEYPFTNVPVILPLSDMIIGVFNLPQEHAETLLKNTGNQLLRDWEENDGDSVALVIYNSKDIGLSLNEQYIHAKHALDMKFYKGNRMLFYHDSKIVWKMFDPFLSPSEQRLWIDMLIHYKRDGIKEWMYCEFLNQQEPFPEPGLLRIRLTSILAQVSRFMKSNGLEDDHTSGIYHQVFDIILYNPILYRIVQEFLLFIYEVLDLAAKQKKSARVDVIELAIQFMERNFQRQNLRLEDVAAEVERSSAYLSSLFTKKQGRSFSELLTSIRLKEAQRLLVESTRPIQQIAEMTGFYNPNYFSRLFKQSLGVTPRTFRNQKNMLKA
jgi:two-component system, response regulator YesN